MTLFANAAASLSNKCSAVYSSLPVACTALVSVVCVDLALPVANIRTAELLATRVFPKDGPFDGFTSIARRDRVRVPILVRHAVDDRVAESEAVGLACKGHAGRAVEQQETLVVCRAMRTYATVRWRYPIRVGSSTS